MAWHVDTSLKGASRATTSRGQAPEWCAEAARWAGIPCRFGRLGGPNRPTQEDDVALSARNQLRGTVTSVKLGTVMAEVVVDVGGNEIVSAITRGSAEALGLSEGSAVTVVIKATEVLLATDGS
jgi:molybdopterin-binding protein